jgi:cell division septum initiation protein DivIVA
MARVSHDTGLLQAALYGFQVEKEQIDAKIRELQAQLKGAKAPAAAVKAAHAGGRRKMSAAARARIAAAQKKRWAEFHKKKTQGSGS